MGHFTYIWSLDFLRILKDVPEHIHLGVGLNGDPCAHPFLVNEADELLRAGETSRSFVSGILGGDRGNRGLIVETVEIAAGLLEFSNPFLWLFTINTRAIDSFIAWSLYDETGAYLADHHMAIERPTPAR